MTSPEVRDFVEFLEKERNDSPHTVKAYGRDLADFVAFCGRYYGGAWSWAGVDRLAIRAWLGAQQQRGLAKRSAARALSALRTFYRFLNATRGLEVNPAKAARTPKLERKLPDYLDRAEIDLLFEEAERRAAAGGFREGGERGPGLACAFVAPLVRDASAGRRRRPAGGAGAVGPRLALHHPGVYSYVGGALEEGLSPGPPPGVGPHPLTPLSAMRRGGTSGDPPLPKGEGDRG